MTNRANQGKDDRTACEGDSALIGWRSRGYHPHFDRPGLVQSLTFRLRDSVPESLVQRWRGQLGLTESHPIDDDRTVRLRRRLEHYADAGHGACLLRDRRIASVAETALLHFDGERYRLLAWCVMPNHVHVLVETIAGRALAQVVQSWKSFAAKEANKLLGKVGAFWMPDYHDRFIRDARHFDAVRRYVEQNPVKAGLCDRAEEWRFGSAWAAKREPASCLRTEGHNGDPR